MGDLRDRLAEVVGAEHVLVGDAISPDYSHDECLSVPPQAPTAVVRPACTAEVAAVVRIAAEQGVGVTARGSATGMSGACIPDPAGIVVSFERMARILEIDVANHAAVVQPGVTLDRLDEATAAHGLIYPVFPGESSASLGGNVATNAGGMRAVKYGVTRHHVLGLEAVLASGDVIRTGGKVVKSSTGVDLTQLLVGSEGTLALITEVTVKLHPRLAHRATILAPFATVDAVAAAVPVLIGDGVGPMICVAGGSGLAPILSLLQDAANRKVRRDCILLFGARGLCDLYAAEELAAIRNSWTASFDYWPVLSEEKADGYRQGFVTDFIPTALESLGSGAHGYMCGPPPMIDAGVSKLVQAGLALDDIHYDKFTDASTKA